MIEHKGSNQDYEVFIFFNPTYTDSDDFQFEKEIKVLYQVYYCSGIQIPVERCDFLMLSIMKPHHRKYEVIAFMFVMQYGVTSL